MKHKTLLILFGLPGTGKSYVSEIMREDFNFFVYDGDDDLSDDMQHAITHQHPINDSMRNIFFNKLKKSITHLLQTQQKIAVTQTFIKEKYRKQVLKEFPHAEFILIQTDTKVRETRLAKRTNYPLDKVYAREMVRVFEKPEIQHVVIVNDSEGKEEIRKQLKNLLSSPLHP